MLKKDLCLFFFAASLTARLRRNFLMSYSYEAVTSSTQRSRMDLRRVELLTLCLQSRRSTR